MKDAGFVLITFLLLLSLLSLLILEIGDNIIEQYHLQRYVQRQQQLFNAASAGLQIGEETLRDNCQPALCIMVKSLAHWTDESQTSPIQIHYYAITAIARQTNLSVTLQSTSVVFDPVQVEYKGIKPGRQSWRQIIEKFII